MRTWTAADLLIEREALAPSLSCGEVLKRFEDPLAPPAYAVAYDGGFGLIDRVSLASMLAQQFGRALFERRKVTEVMDPDPLVVERMMTIHEISAAIADSKPSALQTCFIITEDGEYLGIGLGLDLLRLTAEHAVDMLERLKSTQESLVRSEKLAALGSLVAGIAHEINTPVGVTVTATTQFGEIVSQLRERFTEGAMRKSDLERFIHTSEETARLVLVNAERTAELVKSFKQVAVDQASDDRRPFDLSEYLQSVVASMRPQLKKYDHKLVIDCPSGIVVDGYPGAISQMVANLLNNALTHAFDRQASGTIRIAATLEENDTILLSFADDGRGIPAEYQSKIFEPFFTTARGSGGSGLGLNIVHNIATQTLHGEIWLESAPGAGSCFYIRFPRNAPDAIGLSRDAARFGGTAS